MTPAQVDECLYNRRYGPNAFKKHRDLLYCSLLKSTMSSSNSTSRSPTSPNISSGYTPYNPNGNFNSGFIF